MWEVVFQMWVGSKFWCKIFQNNGLVTVSININIVHFYFKTLGKSYVLNIYVCHAIKRISVSIGCKFFIHIMIEHIWHDNVLVEGLSV